MRTQLIHSNSTASLTSLGSGNGMPALSPDGKRSMQKPEEKKFELCSQKRLKKAFPVLTWGREYTAKKAISDLIAGITVGLTILPQGLAYATVAGLPPIYGLYSGFMGCFVYILFGSTKAITIGPNAIQCVLTLKYTAGKPPEYAVFLCFVCGLVMMAMYFLRLGFVTNFISSPVISSFTTAVSITICMTQVKGLLGIKFEGEGFVPTIQGAYDHFHEVKMGDFYMSVVCISALLFLKYLQAIFGCIARRSKVVNTTLWFISTSKNAIVIIGATALMYYKYPEPGKPFSLVGHITPGLPYPQMAPFSIYNKATNKTEYLPEIMREMSTAMIVMPILGLMGHMTIAKAFAGSARVESSQEILSIGLSNLLSSFFSSMPIAGSFSRTTVNAMSGAESPAGGFVTGVMVILALQFLTPTFFFIPKASLASVVCCSIIFMIEPLMPFKLWKSKKMDLVPWALTLLMTLFVGLEWGIGTGVVISGIFLIYYAARPRVKIHEGFTVSNSAFVLVTLDRSLTFPCVDYITNSIAKAAQRYGGKHTPVVVDCNHLQYADYTAATALADMIDAFRKIDVKIVFWRMKPSVLYIVQNVMWDRNVDFIHCESEADVDSTVDKMAYKVNGSAEINMH